MKFLKVSKTILNSLLYLQAIPVCTCSAVPAGENVDLGHTATGQLHAFKIDPQIQPAPQILPTPIIIDLKHRSINQSIKQTINQSINDVDRRRLHLRLYVPIVLKTLVLV